MERNGIMSGADHHRVALLQDNAEAGKQLSDDDVEWLLTLLQKPSKQPEILQSRVLLVILHMHIITSAQQQKIRQAMPPLLSGSHPSTARVVLHKLNTMSGEVATR